MVVYTFSTFFGVTTSTFDAHLLSSAIICYHLLLCSRPGPFLLCLSPQPYVRCGNMGLNGGYHAATTAAGMVEWWNGCRCWEKRSNFRRQIFFSGTWYYYVLLVNFEAMKSAADEGAVSPSLLMPTDMSVWVLPKSPTGTLRVKRNQHSSSEPEFAAERFAVTRILPSFLPSRHPAVPPTFWLLRD